MHCVCAAKCKPGVYALVVAGEDIVSYEDLQLRKGVRT